LQVALMTSRSIIEYIKVLKTENEERNSGVDGRVPKLPKA